MFNSTADRRFSLFFLKRLKEVSKVRGTAIVVERSKNSLNVFYRTKHWNTSEVEKNKLFLKTH